MNGGARARSHVDGLTAKPERSGKRTEELVRHPHHLIAAQRSVWKDGKLVTAEARDRVGSA